jgi:hypothetical protein
MYRGVMASSVSESRLAVSISLSKGAGSFKDAIDECMNYLTRKVDQAMLRCKTNPFVGVVIRGLQFRSPIQDNRLQSVRRVPACKIEHRVLKRGVWMVGS